MQVQHGDRGPAAWPDTAPGHRRDPSDNVDVHGPHTEHHGAKGLNFDSPDQVQTQHQAGVKWVGRIGWVAKGIVYAILGGLSIDSSHDAEGETATGTSVSPQGAFILIGSNNAGAPLLIILVCCLVLYIIWRFWEGVTGQGYDAEYSRGKNFFRFRLSPIVSGLVYCSYTVFILNTLVKMAQGADFRSGDNNDLTLSWRQSAIGKAGLCFVGIGFLAGFLVQLDWAIRAQWRSDYRSDLPPWGTKALFAAGRLGYLGRGTVFLSVAVLFFKEVANEYQPEEVETTIATALSQLHENNGLRAMLWIMGFLLVIYGTFAVVSSWARVFPTPPPSRRPKVRPGTPPVVYEVQGNNLGTPHPITEPEGMAAAAAAYEDMETGTAVDAAHPAKLAGGAHALHLQASAHPHMLKADAAFWRRASSQKQSWRTALSRMMFWRRNGSPNRVAAAG